MKKVCFKQIESRLREKSEDIEQQIEDLEARYKSQITETQAAISAIQLDQDQMLDRVRSSQTEILMINKNLASNLKKQRSELTDLQTKCNLNQTIIESMLVQAISLEQTMQAHLDGCADAKPDTNISVKANRLQALSIVTSNAMNEASNNQQQKQQNNTSVMSASSLHKGNSSRLKASSLNRMAPPLTTKSNHQGSSLN